MGRRRGGKQKGRDTLTSREENLCFIFGGLSEYYVEGGLVGLIEDAVYETNEIDVVDGPVFMLSSHGIEGATSSSPGNNNCCS